MIRLITTATLALALFAGVAVTARVSAQDDKPKSFGLVVYKLGEKFATDEKAGEAIDKFAGYLDSNIEGADFKRLGVRNKPDDALKLFKDEAKPVAVAIVSPGFYYTHKSDLKLTALAEAQRDGKDGEQYTLVGAAKVDSYPAGKRIATSMSADTDWLNKAVLRAPKDAKPVVWVQYDNLLDAGYEIIDEEDGAPDFILVDRTTLKLYESDDDLKTLKKGLQSEVLPQDLVVEVDGRLGEKRDALKKTLANLDQTDEGKKIGELLQSPKFPAPDTTRLEKVQKWYDAE
ncbi:MAG: hypothetical protein KDB29_07815 [Planctomycetes bacterium]|nr:hypothetical protein [Planctomycetota bacterium]